MFRKFKPIETYLIVQMVVFGGLLLLPTKTFKDGLYSTMSEIAQEEYWGIVLVAIGFAQFIAMIKDDKRMKVLCLSMTSFIWSSIGTMFLIESLVNQVINTGVIYYTTALFALWLSYKIGGQ